MARKKYQMLKKEIKKVKKLSDPEHGKIIESDEEEATEPKKKREEKASKKLTEVIIAMNP